MTGLSKSILLISIEFLIKFATSCWIRIFKILSHSRVMSYDSFFEKRLYGSQMTHNICNMHIIWLEFLFLIQWCKNFGDSPTQGHVTMTVEKLKLKKWCDFITDDWLIKINFTYQHRIPYKISDFLLDSDFQNCIAF